MRKISIIGALIGIAALAAVVFAQSSAEEAYADLNEELKRIQETAKNERSMERRIQLVREMESLLVEFMGTHPDTPQQRDAMFQAGQLNVMLQQGDRAAKFLGDYIADPMDASRSQLAMAHYFLAEAHKIRDDWDAVEQNYQIIIDSYGDVDSRLTQFAQRSLTEVEFQRRLAVGKEPIPFEVKSLEGEVLSPDKYKGKVLLIDFWATWCGPCIKEMPHVKSVYDKYNDKGFEIVGISLDRTRSALDRYIAQNDIEWPQYFDGKDYQNAIAVKYRVNQIPTTYLIDREGKIRYKSLRGNQLEVAVKKLINEE